MYEALNNRPDLEVRRRLEGLLKEVMKSRLAAAELRALRAIRVLEQIGTPQARQVLHNLSGGAGDFLRTEEAKAVLGRLRKRRATSPSD